MTIEQVMSHVRNVPDFPVKGIQFKDVTTLFKDPDCLRWLRDEVVDLYRDKGITKVIGMESRGFVIASAVAMELGAGFVPIRKPGKLPAETLEVSYTKEYGEDKIQIHTDALSEDDVVLIHDDLLATGGTLAAAVKLVRRMKVKKIYVNFLIELDDLEGRKLLDSDLEITSLMHFKGE